MCIINRNIIKAPWLFSLFKLSSFFCSKNKLKSNEKVCKNKDFCKTIMPSKKDNILEFNLL